MEKAGIGIIGCGSVSWFVAHGYLEGAIKDGKAEIVAVCDLREEKAKETAEDIGAKKVYKDYHQLLKNGDVDAVEILLPHHLHAPVAIAAAEAGKHVSCIKPFARNIQECNDMIKATRKAGVKLRYLEPEYYFPPNVKAKELIESGEIGEPRVIDITNCFGGYTNYSRTLPGRATSDEYSFSWRRDIKECGGTTLFDHGSHKFATARYLMSEIAEVLGWVGVKWREEHVHGGTKGTTCSRAKARGVEV